MDTKHAVFATDYELNRYRVSAWLGLGAAHDVWEALDAKRTELDDVKFVEVRQLGDPKYSALPYAPWLVLADAEKPTYVSLSRPERQRLLDIGRRAGGRDDAASAIMDELLGEPRWGHLAAVVISDYAWAAANFCFPHEAKYL